nr:hypothetical protein GCM10020093_097910 [Planobispora longispora]
MEIRASTVLPARREPIELHTADGLTLVGELALPGAAPGRHAGLPAPAAHARGHDGQPRLQEGRQPAAGPGRPRGPAVQHARHLLRARHLRGAFDGGEGERFDVAAALEYAEFHDLPSVWLVGWSFGTELALKWGHDPLVRAAILLSPPLHRAGDADLDAWAAFGRPLTALVPEFDDYLRPEEARARFARVPQAEVVGVEGAKHLWVGEPYVRIVLDEIVRRVNPAAHPCRRRSPTRRILFGPGPRGAVP